MASAASGGGSRVPAQAAPAGHATPSRHPAASARRFTPARRAVQSAFALFFLVCPFLAPAWLGGTAIALRLGPVDVLEPTSALSATLASGALATVTVLGVLPFTAVTLACGSVFCAWVCPYGLVSEGLDRLRGGRHRRWSGTPWASARLPRFASLAVLLALSLLLGAPWVAVLAPPRILSALPLEARVLAAVPGVTAALLALVLALDLGLGRRVVCRVLCPVGAGTALLRAPFTWRPRFDRERCRCQGVATCLTVCNWGLDPREMAWCDGCTSCLACVEHCPSGALQIRVQPPQPHSMEER
jgi:ferredoxin-type protein NapH